MIIEKPDGTIELEHSDAALAPGARGLQVNSVAAWYRINGGAWRRAECRAMFQLRRLAERCATAAQFGEEVDRL